MANTEIVLFIVLTTMLILLLIAGIVISFFIASREKAKQQVVLAEAKLNYEKELRKVEVEVGEHLMQKIALELHDNIGQILTCVHLEVENRKLDHPALEPSFNAMTNYLNEASSQLRLLSRSLNTEFVTKTGLQQAIDAELVRQLKLNRFAIDWQSDNQSSTLDSNQQLVAFRIFQEILNNAMKHSHARNLVVRLSFARGFELQVADDGNGFSLPEVLNRGASGVANILRRASLAGFHCDISTQPGSGCKYMLRNKNQIV